LLSEIAGGLDKMAGLPEFGALLRANSAFSKKHSGLTQKFFPKLSFAEISERVESNPFLRFFQVQRPTHRSVKTPF
jgi:hypothetical protein